MARLAPIQPPIGHAAARPGETDLAFRYLYHFRRIVVGLALLGALAAYVERWPGLLAISLCVGTGELLESSYYLSVLRWRQREAGSAAGSVGAVGSTQPTTSSASDVTNTPTNTA